jgi:hypothetical protein
MSSPDDRPRDLDHDERDAQAQTHETESRLDHVDPDEHMTPDDVRREQLEDERATD